jgi:hypothetical protein
MRAALAKGAGRCRMGLHLREGAGLHRIGAALAGMERAWCRMGAALAGGAGRCRMGLHLREGRYRMRLQSSASLPGQPNCHTFRPRSLCNAPVHGHYASSDARDTQTMHRMFLPPAEGQERDIGKLP